MPRKSVVVKRETLPDPKYNSKMLAKFVNVLMRKGKKSTAEAICYILAAVQDYYQAQAASAALDAALESERAARESFAAAEARYNAGSATPADKLQAQTAYSQATLNRITADGNLKNAQGTLANMLGLDANRNVLVGTGRIQSRSRMILKAISTR